MACSALLELIGFSTKRTNLIFLKTLNNLKYESGNVLDRLGKRKGLVLCG